MRIIIYSLQNALKNLWRERWVNVLTVLTIAVGLLILGTFSLITINMDAAIKRLSKGFGIVVYLNSGLNANEEKSVGEKLQQDADISEIKYISKDSALNELKQTLGTMTSVLGGFDENPLPSSFELKLKGEALEPDVVKRKVSQIKQLSGVEDVQYGEKWLSSLSAMTLGMKIMAVLLGGMVFVAIVFSTYSTIKILFYRRIEEIETLKLLGATRTFIRLPFLFEGLFIGMLGGIIAFSLLFIFYSMTTSKMVEFLPSVKGLMMFFSPQTYPIIPLTGAVLSLIGSFFAIGRIRY